jgi:hypothetical protein
MRIFDKKLDLLTLVAIVIMAISISIFDVGDLSWKINSTSYVGFIIFFIAVIVKYLTIRKNG